ncbi:SDR family oxidoreductase [bacterium]|nr:SDR family oxidoreductase [bacterium]MBT4649417.1 SDR family oxidoreductase [bacterium]
MQKNIVLVTGGAGFIGSNIVKTLVERAYVIKVLDNISTGYLKNLDSIMDKIEFIEGDINDSELLNKILPGVNFVLHQAALPSVPRSIDDPIKSHHNNVTGTLNLLTAAKKNKVQRVVIASSSSVYGDREEEYKVETLKPQPLSPYAVTKYASEVYCKVFSHIYDLETVCLRYFNVFGPQQDPNSPYSAVIPLFVKAIQNNQAPTIFGDGNHSRDFTFVQNNVEANILAMHSDKVGKGETINIACGKSFSLIYLMDQINKILNKNIKANFTDNRPGDIKKSLADISKAEKLLGYKPVINFDDGLKQTVDWLVKKNEKN